MCFYFTVSRVPTQLVSHTARKQGRPLSSNSYAFCTTACQSPKCSGECQTRPWKQEGRRGNPKKEGKWREKNFIVLLYTSFFSQVPLTFPFPTCLLLNFPFQVLENFVSFETNATLPFQIPWWFPEQLTIQ